MAKPKFSTVFFSVKFFSLFLGLFVTGILALIAFQIPSFEDLNNFELDTKFRLTFRQQSSVLREGAIQQNRNLLINPDILILGVDNRTLDRFGRWPFPRFRHADLLNTFTRIKNQEDREAAVLLDFFFFDTTEDPVSDALLRDAIESNRNFFLETVPAIDPFSFDLQETMTDRFEILNIVQPSFQSLQGDWTNVQVFQGMSNPLIPFSEVAKGYGHALFEFDTDGTFRKQRMVLRYSSELGSIPFQEVLADPSILLEADEELFIRWGYLNQLAYSKTVPFELLNNPEEISRILTRDSIQRTFIDDSGQEINDYVLRLYQDFFLPSVALRLAAHYLFVPLEDIYIEFGKHIIIPEPKRYDYETGELKPYRILEQLAEYDGETGDLLTPEVYRELDELVIPIDDQGNMIINFIGPRSTEDTTGFQIFPVRSYSGYAGRATGPLYETWPESLRLQDKIILAGAFSQGMADDEKLTPHGLMYGIEIHANTLNTIIMDNFLYPVPPWTQILIAIILTLFIAFYSGRTPTYIGLISTIIILIGFFLVNTFVLFDNYSQLLPYPFPAISGLVTFVLVVVYRVMTEEKDKKRIRNMFGRYVSPGVVDQILANPPELGGVDKELTVFFSDIRGFTTLSESMTPQELVNHLNIYLTAMTDVILEYQGTLDKYVGDEIMCFWGAPLLQSEHAFLACQCALKQIEKLTELNDGWPPEKRIDIGIGINSGIMTVGNMGSIGRMNYTLMGDNVNLGARLEGTNKAYLTQIIISEYTYGLVKDRVIARELDNIRVKGKNKPVLIYELIALQE